METSSDIKWVYSRKSGKWEIVKDRNADNVSLPPSTPPSSKAGCGGEGPSGEGGGGGGGGRGNNNWVGNSDEPPLPPFPTGNDPYDSSSSSDSSNNPRRRGLGGLPPLPPGGSTRYSGSVRGHSPGQKYEKKQSKMKLPKVFKGDPSDDTLPY